MLLEAQGYVRRPLRGLRLKRETFATMSVAGPGVSAVLANSSVPDDFSARFTSNFIIQSVSETRVEKFQALTTFGAPYGFFFGEQPRMVTVGATLLNTADFQWEIEWWDNYDNFFRGTQLVNRNMRCYLSYDDVVIEGYLTQAGTNKGAENTAQVQLTFTMWVTNVTYLVTPGDPKIDPIHSSEFGNSASLEFANVSNDGDYVSITEEVRARNIESIAYIPGTGLLAALGRAVEAVNDFVDKVGNIIDSAVDFLYGRNMVIPAGFAGSEVTSGQATFASGSGFESLGGVNLGGVLDGSSINIRVPGSVTGVPVAHLIDQDFYQNTDEYPSRAFGSRLSAAQISAALNETFGVGLSGTSRDEQNQIYVELSKATFGEFGYQIENETGRQTSAFLRRLGRAAFGTLSYAAMTTGLSQSAASLTVVGGTTGNTNADEQQAAAEASA